MTVDIDRTERAILDLVRARGPDKSICPTEAARALAPGLAPDDWRPHLGPVRQAALRLAKAGRLQILRKGKPVTGLDGVRGVIRLRVALDEL